MLWDVDTMFNWLVTRIHTGMIIPDEFERSPTRKVNEKGKKKNYMASLLLGFIERSTFHVDAASPFYQLVFMKFIQLCSKVLFFFYFCHSLEMRLYTWKWGKNSDATKKITRSRTDCFNKLNRFAPKIFLFIKNKGWDDSWTC